MTMSGYRSRALSCLLIGTLLVNIPHRLPAPIVEPTETATAAPEYETSQPKHPSKSKRRGSESEVSEKSKPAEPAKPKPPQDPFAGTWTGKINQGLWGKVLFSFTLPPGASQVTEDSAFGTYSHPATSDGRTATWNSGVLNEITWTFTPNSDGTTAQVTAKSALGVNGSAVFQRGGRSATATARSEFPIAKAVPEKPGFVYNPYDPTGKHLLDVTGKPSGTKVKDPSTGKMFIVP